MAAEEDGDVFEITDFTTASDWERFIARLEEVLHEWKLVNRDPLPNAAKGKFTEGPWEEKSEEIQFADFKFLISYTRLKRSGDAEAESRSSREREEADDDRHEDEHKTPTVLHDIISTDNDFPSRAHCLCRWYGLQEFLVIQPAPNFGIIDTESRARILQSSASIALSNSSCHVPVFVQLQQKWRKLYSGVAVVPGANVQFEMCHLKKLPPKFQHLDGLLDMFKGKLGCEYISMPPVSVSVRFTYILEDWIHCPWPQLPPDFSSFSEGEVGCSELDVLPFGACEDPVSELHLSCTWPYLSADMIVETSGYSDLDPLQAPVWSVRIQMTEDPQCLLGQYLRAFMELCGRTETTDEILGRAIMEQAGGEGGLDRDGSAGGSGGGEDITNALQRLTEPGLPYHIPSLGSVVSRATSRLKIKPEEAPIPPKLLNKILLHLFPDATGLGGSPKRNKGGSSQSKESTPTDESAPQGSTSRVEEVYSEALKQLRSCSPDSLTYRLAVSFAIINHNHGGLRALAHLWQEFVLEMRYRWENGIIIPGLGASATKTPMATTTTPPSPTSTSTPTSSPHALAGTGAPAPNLGSCLLHQKLQMLNCCIERKVKREATGYGMEGTMRHEFSSTSVFDADDATDSSSAALRPDNDLASCGDRQGRGSVASSSNDDDDGDDNDDEEEGEEENEDEDEDEFFECEEGDDDDNEEVDGESGGGGEKEKEKKVSTATTTTETSPRRLRRRSSSSGGAGGGGKRTLPSDKSVDSSVSETSFKDARAVVKPEGRLAPMKNIRSLSTGEQLFIPITQEPSPMTEDMLEEQAEVLAKLGSSPQGSQLRARMQSACLLSDMESFKAANPGCCLEDFVRWYSPRDYVEEEEEEDEVEEEERARNVERKEVVGGEEDKTVRKETVGSSEGGQQNTVSQTPAGRSGGEEAVAESETAVDPSTSPVSASPSQGDTTAAAATATTAEAASSATNDAKNKDNSASSDSSPNTLTSTNAGSTSSASATAADNAENATSAVVETDTDVDKAASADSSEKDASKNEKDGGSSEEREGSSDSNSGAGTTSQGQESSSREVTQGGEGGVTMPQTPGRSRKDGGVRTGVSSSSRLATSPSQGAGGSYLSSSGLSSSSPASSSSPSSLRHQQQRRGRLSQRMQIPGNVWVDVWQNARHMPARRQKRLFDDTKEAEKVLHFLAGLRPGELVLHLLPMLVHASLLKLAEKEDPDVPVLKTLTDQVLSKATKVTRGPQQPPDTKRYEDVIRMIELAETVSSRAQSLKTKFTKDLLEKGKAEEELHVFVSSLLQHPEVDVRGGAYGPAGNAIRKLFSAAQKAALMILEEEEDDEENNDKGGKEEKKKKEKSVTQALNEHVMKPASTVHDFPPPSAREYVLRAMIPRPAPFSRVLPQRMYCVIVDGDYRLAGAFCSDTTFQ